MIFYENLKLVNSLYAAELNNAAQRVINSGHYILGSEVSNFETSFAKFLNANFCIGVGTGLDAIEIGLQSLDLPKGSEVLVASNTYIATILAVVNCGLSPVLVEPDPNTYNVTADSLINHITNRTSAICVTHMYGKPCNMPPIRTLASTHGLRLIEDCAQAHGAKVLGRYVGTFGDVGAFSFYPTKNLGALGDGGAIICASKDLADKARAIRNYGSEEKYKNLYIGRNSRLDEMQAAFLNVKLSFLNDFILKKQQLSNIYFERLKDFLVLPVKEPDIHDVFHIFSARHPDRDRLRRFLLKNNIQTEVHYPIPPHKQTAYQDMFKNNTFPISETIHNTQISLPLSVAHSDAQLNEVCDVICEFFSK